MRFVFRLTYRGNVEERNGKKLIHFGLHFVEAKDYRAAPSADGKAENYDKVGGGGGSDAAQVKKVVDPGVTSHPADLLKSLQQHHFSFFQDPVSDVTLTLID
jgi:hypothetical protein